MVSLQISLYNPLFFYNNPKIIDSIPSNVDPRIVGRSCLFVNTGVNAENIPIRNTNTNTTNMFSSIVGENIDGGIPMNNTENSVARVNIMNPRVM